MFFRICPLLFLALMVDAKGTWQVLPIQPPARSKHGQEAINSQQIFIWGGRNVVGTGLNDAWVYNITDKTFQAVQVDGDVPGGRMGGTVAAVTRISAPAYPLIYIFSGQQDGNILYDFYMIDTKTWLSIPMPKPPIRGRWRSSSVSLGTVFVVCFGIGRGVEEDVWMFDSVTSTWTELVPVNPLQRPSARFDPCCTAYNNTAFLCFGGTQVDVTDSNEIFMFDINFKRWEKVIPNSKSLPSPRRVAGCVYDSASKKLIISNGWYANQLVSLKDLWHFHFPTRTWIEITDPSTSLNVPMDSVRWTLMPTGKAYMFGGWGSTTINTMYEHNIANTSLSIIYPNNNQPSARSLHCVVGVGLVMYLMFGSSVDGFPLDVWKYTTNTMKWSRVLPPGLTNLRAPTCTAYGSSIFIFGGRTSLTDSTFSNTLYLYETTKDSMSSIELTDKPPVRWRHAACMYQGNLVIYGGQSSQVLGDMWVFDMKQFNWKRIALSPGKKSGAMIGVKLQHTMVAASDGFIVVNGGDGNANTGDKWFCTMTIDGKTASGSCDNLTSVVDVDMTKTDITRAYAVTILSFKSTTMYIFGGQLDSASTNSRASFVMWDRLTGVNTLMPRMPIAVTEGSGVFIGNTIYFFGGRLADRGTVLEPVTAFQSFQFWDGSFCEDNSETSGCQTCPFGFVGPKCVPCPVNTYYKEETGFCEACDTSRVNSRVGLVGRSSCTYTSSSLVENVSISGDFDSVTYSQQPDPYDPPTPTFSTINIIIIIVTVVVGIPVLLMVASAVHRRARRREWLNDEMKEILVSCYTRIMRDGSGGTAHMDKIEEGMDERELYLALQHISTADTRYVVSEDWVAAMLSKHDDDGSRKLGDNEFIDLVLECMLSPKINFAVDWERLGYTGEVQPELLPIPLGDERDDAVEQLIARKRRAVNSHFTFRLNSLDIFKDQHSAGNLGEPVIVKATNVGGFTSLAWIVGLSVIVLLLSTQHIYDNIVEERTLLPKLVVNVNISSSVKIIIKLQNSGYYETDTDMCDTLILNTTEIKVLDGSTIVPKCTMDRNNLIVTWYCKRCDFGEGTASMSLDFADSRAYAEVVTASIETSSGINRKEGMAFSSTRRSVRALLGQVFRGTTSLTNFETDIYPVVYVPLNTVVGADSTTGFLVAITSSTKGSTVSPDQFQNTHGMKVGLKFTVKSSSTLIVGRRYTTTDVSFVSSLLGALSGFVGICVWAMKMFERWIVEKASQLRARRHRASTNPKEANAAFESTEISHVNAICPPNMPDWWPEVAHMMSTGKMTFAAAKSSMAAVLSVANRQGIGMRSGSHMKSFGSFVDRFRGRARKTSDTANEGGISNLLTTPNLDKLKAGLGSPKLKNTKANGALSEIVTQTNNHHGGRRRSSGHNSEAGGPHHRNSSTGHRRRSSSEASVSHQVVSRKGNDNRRVSNPKSTPYGEDDE